MSATINHATRTIGVVTTSRADFGYYRSLLRNILDDPRLDLRLYVSGTHLSASHGSTVRAIEAEGFPIAERIEVLLDGDTPASIATSCGMATMAFAQVFRREAPDILVVLGDRFEMFAIAAASVPFGIPLAHIEGGEVTAGAMDDVYRHALTKMSHFHFVATDEFGRRVIAMGEHPERVFVVGSPGLDNMLDVELAPIDEVERAVGLDFGGLAPLLVTYHPVTLGDEAGSGVDQLLGALADVEHPIVFSGTNADTHSHVIREAIAEFVAQRENAVLVESLGTRLYLSLMSRGRAMLGNSSSGIIEAASFALPVVNIGARQQGRSHGPNVIDVATNLAAIRGALERASSEEFRASLDGMKNPYGDGMSGPRIAEILANASLGPALLRKGFYEREV